MLRGGCSGGQCDESNASGRALPLSATREIRGSDLNYSPPLLRHFDYEVLARLLQRSCMPFKLAGFCSFCVRSLGRMMPDFEAESCRRKAAPCNALQSLTREL